MWHYWEMVEASRGSKVPWDIPSKRGGGGHSKPSLFLFHDWSLWEQFSSLHILTAMCYLPTGPEARGLFGHGQKAPKVRPNKLFFFWSWFSLENFVRVMGSWLMHEHILLPSLASILLIPDNGSRGREERRGSPTFHSRMLQPNNNFHWTEKRDSWDLSTKQFVPGIISLWKVYYPHGIFWKD